MIYLMCRHVFIVGATIPNRVRRQVVDSGMDEKSGIYAFPITWPYK